jgi:hypothetical protein
LIVLSLFFLFSRNSPSQLTLSPFTASQDLVPSSTSVLLDILEHNFPHKRLDVETHRCFLSNILQVAAYCEALKSSILGLAIKNILQIDVRRALVRFALLLWSVANLDGNE